MVDFCDDAVNHKTIKKDIHTHSQKQTDKTNRARATLVPTLSSPEGPVWPDETRAAVLYVVNTTGVPGAIPRQAFVIRPQVMVTLSHQIVLRWLVPPDCGLVHITTPRVRNCSSRGAEIWNNGLLPFFFIFPWPSADNHTLNNQFH